MASADRFEANDLAHNLQSVYFSIKSSKSGFSYYPCLLPKKIIVDGKHPRVAVKNKRLKLNQLFHPANDVAKKQCE